MSQKTTEFLSSFGVMLVGLFLLLGGSLLFGKTPVNHQPVKMSFPASGLRSILAGGDVTEQILPISRPRVPLAKNKESFSALLSAASALVLDDKTNTILFKKNDGAVRPLASITKLMSALVLVGLPLNWASTTTVTEADVDTSSHHINVGEEFSLEDLWHVALIGSSNSAINTLVRESGLSPAEFAERMNKKAADLHLEPMRFVEPTGLDSANVGNAQMTAKLLKEALAVDKIYQTLQIGEYYAQPLNKDKARRVWTTDWLLTNWIPNNFNKDEMAGKTGYILDAGYNFVVRFMDSGGRSLRIVILGAASNEARFSEARDLANWAFGHYLWPDDNGYDKLAE